MKPILFNTEMVRAILEGRKTVTRRVVKPQSKNACGFYVTIRTSDGAFMGVYDYDENEKMFDNSQTPPACVGQVLYVRETWTDWSCAECDGDCISDNGIGCTAPKYLYKADGAEINKGWKPSIHMPKAAARIFLKVTGVRVERLQDMKLTDFFAEGVKNLCDSCNMLPFNKCDTCGREAFTKMSFMALWDSTIKPDQLKYYSWEANPYVWVIEFEVITKEEALKYEQ